MPYVVAFVLVVVFTVNVAVGALGDAPIVSNVVEVLILFAAAIAFSVGILKSEADAASGRPRCWSAACSRRSWALPRRSGA